MLDERTRAFRRHQTNRHMWRRLKEDWNEHYRRPNYLERSELCPTWRPLCPCFTDPKAMARFKEQPQTRSQTYWRDEKHWKGRLVMSARDQRMFDAMHDDLDAWQEAADWRAHKEPIDAG